MSARVIYEIARFDPHGEEEPLVESVRVVESNGSVSWGAESGAALAVADARAVIRGEASLHEVRANQITRITASPDVVDDLPLLLTCPGDRDDFDSSAWSTTLHDEHVEQTWVPQTGRFRVLYVYGQRLCPWPTASGDKLLPEDWPTIRLDETWAELSFIENGSMVSGFGKTSVGPIGSRVLAANMEPDPGLDYGEQEVRLWMCDGTVAGDARILLEWLADNPLERFWGLSMGLMLPRLFVEATLNGRNGKPMCGEMLAAGEEYQPDIGGTPSAEWRLTLNVSEGVVQSALDQMTQQGSELRDLVIAVRNPDSEAGRARRELLGSLGY